MVIVLTTRGRFVTKVERSRSRVEGPSPNWKDEEKDRYVPLYERKTRRINKVNSMRICFRVSTTKLRGLIKF